MSILAYTSYNEVRSVLGVSDDELEDETLALEMYYTGLLEDLAEVTPNLEQIYTELPETGETPVQKRVRRLVKTFSTYSVAKQLAHSLPMFAPRSLGDGKATMSRFLEPYKETIKGIDERFDVTKDRLSQAVSELLSENRTVTPRTLFAAATLSRDPVTTQS